MLMHGTVLGIGVVLCWACRQTLSQSHFECLLRAAFKLKLLLLA